MTSALFSPLKLAGLELENRIVVSPMCQYVADDGSATDWHLGHLAMLANSGAALLVDDMIALARAMLDDPRWGWHAAQALAGEVKRPPQSARAAPKLWPGAAYRA